MATISFWARADSITAQNATLNPIGTTGANGVPAFQLTFTDNSGAGDLFIEQPVGGGIDPDTQVIIGGITYDFTLQLVGILPGNSQVPATLVGETVAVIVVNIGGVNREYFFVVGGLDNLNQPVTQALMNDIGPGAIPLESVDITPPPICFCAGTMIATPSGARAVETLVAGDMVLNDRGEACQIIWTGKSRFSLAELRNFPDIAPIRIRAGAFGPGLPDADLLVSPQHRIVLEGPAAELLFGEDRVLAAAKHLVGIFSEGVEPDADVEYHHILTEAHEILVANGLATESFQPARRNIDAMAPEVQKVLESVLSTLGRSDMLTRKDALPSLKSYEIRALAVMMTRMSAWLPNRTVPASVSLH